MQSPLYHSPERKDDPGRRLSERYGDETRIIKGGRISFRSSKAESEFWNNAPTNGTSGPKARIMNAFSPYLSSDILGIDELSLAKRLHSLTPYQLKTLLEKVESISSLVSETRKEVNGVEYMDLKREVKSVRKEAMRKLLPLMKELHVSNVGPLSIQREEGCLFHIPLTMKEITARVHQSVTFTILYSSKSKEVLAFTEIQDSQALKEKAGTIQHQQPPYYRWLRDLLEEEADQNAHRLAHEQLVAVNKPAIRKLVRNRKLESGLKIGSQVLTEGFRVLQERGYKAVTTEVQSHPENNRSRTFHVDNGFRTVGHFPPEDIIVTDERGNLKHESIAFEVFIKPLSLESRRDFVRQLLIEASILDA